MIPPYQALRPNHSLGTSGPWANLWLVPVAYAAVVGLPAYLGYRLAGAKGAWAGGLLSVAGLYVYETGAVSYLLYPDEMTPLPAAT